MTSIYGFSGGPKFRGMTSGDFIDAAMDQPLSLMSTLFDQTKGGVLDSLGVGTAIQETFIPAGTGEGDTFMRKAGRELAGLAAIPVPGVFGAVRTAVQSQINTDQKALSEDDYKRSPHFRKNIPWDAGMTEARAKALADWDDHREIRKFYGAKRPITAFIGGLMGQALDPINYIPIAGPAVKAAAIARAGRIGGAALTGSLDAAANTAIFGVATRETRRPYGSDVSWQATVSEIAVAALIGSAFGGIAGALEARGASRAAAEAQTRLGTLRTTQEARIALNEAIDAVVRGEPVALSPNATEPIARTVDQINSGEMSPPVRKDAPAASDDVQPVAVDMVDTSLDEAVDMVKTAVRESGAEGQFWGLRVLEEEDITPGTALQPSRIWVDGEPTEDMLDGASAIRFDPEDDNSIRKALIAIGGYGGHNSYFGRTVAVANADRGRPGEDRMEVVMRDATASAVFKRAKPTGPIVKQTPIAPRAVEPSQVDTAPARSEQPPEGRVQAEARIAKPDDAKAIAEQHAVHPETGEFPEIAEIDQLRAEGRLTADDETALEEAQNMLDDAGAYGEALASVTRCLL